MAVHFSFAATNFRKSVPCIGESLSLAELKDAIAAPLVAALKGKKLREAFDFRVYDSDTKTEILGADSKIRKNASVIVKRVPYFQQFSNVASISTQSSALSSISTQSQSSSLAPISTQSIERSNGSSTRSEVIDDDFGDEIYSAPPTSKNAPSAAISTHSAVIDDEFGDNVYAAPIMHEVVKTSSKKRAAPHDEVISIKRRMKEQSDLASKPAVNVRIKQETGEKIPTGKKEESAVQSVEKLPTELTCPLCNKMLKEPMMIPCCFLTFCGDCIKVALAKQKKCPKCLSCKFGVANLLHNRHMNIMIDARLKSSSSPSNPR